MFQILLLFMLTGLAYAQWLQISANFTSAIIKKEQWGIYQLNNCCYYDALQSSICPVNNLQYANMDDNYWRFYHWYNFNGYYELQMLFDVYYDGADTNQHSKLIVNLDMLSPILTTTNIYSNQYLASDLSQQSNRLCRDGTDYAFGYFTVSTTPKTITSSSSSINFLFYPQTSSQKVGIRNVLIYANACFSTCKTCSGQNSNQCQSCWSGSLIEGQCACRSSYYKFLLNKSGCYQECPNNYYIADSNLVCIPDRRIKNKFNYLYSSKILSIAPFTFIPDILDQSNIDLISKDCLKDYDLLGYLSYNKGVSLQISAIQALKFIRLRITFNLINLQINSKIKIALDGVQQAVILRDSSGYSFQNALSIYQIHNYCSLTSQIRIETILLTSSLAPLLVIQGSLQSASESWGFRGVYIDTGLCRENCQTCKGFASCQQCVSGFKLYQGGCVIYCPIHSINCVDYADEYPYSKYLAKGFYDMNMTIDDIKMFYDSVTNENTNFYTGQKFGFFPNKFVLGGVLVWNDASYVKAFNIPDPHYAVTVRFNMTFGDEYSGEFYYSIDSVQEGPFTLPSTGQNIVGKQQQERTKFFYKYLNPFPQTTLNIELKCVNTASIDYRDGFCAVSEYFIVVHYCSPFCDACTSDTVCTTWQAGYTSSQCALDQYLAFDSTLTSYSCNSCKTGCLTCNSFNNCITCDQNNNFFLIGELCWCLPFTYLAGNTCIQCNKYCETCNGPQSNNCETCILQFHRFIVNSQCECQLGYYDDGLQLPCLPKCGDILIADGEDCDDGNFNPFDGCHNCQYSCIEGCSNCIQGVCYECLENWEYFEITADCKQTVLQLNSLEEQFNEINQFFCQISCNKCIDGICILCIDGFQLDLITHSCDTLCGDTIIIGNELCDDGNNVSTDGCNQCQIISNDNDNEYYAFDLSHLESNQYCGDSITQGTEDCDDGNMDRFDGCHNCQYSCIQGCLNCVYGICYECQEDQIFVEITQQCIQLSTSKHPFQETKKLDDCPIQCANCIQNKCIECFNNYIINKITNICDSQCGDLMVNGNEQCDDGNNDIYDGCDQCLIIEFNLCDDNCSFCYQGECQQCNQGHSLSNNVCLSICGDMLVNKQIIDGQQIEQCDNPDSEGCINCVISPGFLCVGDEYSICETCDSKCKECFISNDNLLCKNCLEGYFPVGNDCLQCNSNCIACHIQSDRCTSCFRKDCQKCENINGLFTDRENKKCSPQCGDGITIKPDEECDDGNQEDWDGCSSNCKSEFIREGPTVSRYKGDNSNDLSISNMIDIIYNCSDTSVIIEGFQKSEFAFNSTSLNNGCQINFIFFKSIYPYNLIYITIAYTSIFNRMLSEVREFPPQIPVQQIILSPNQQQQAETIQNTQSYFYLLLWILAPLSVLFGVFEYFWAVLEILSWINNFYFLNVQYPFNVEVLFKNSDWSSLVSFPTYSALNQPECEYYFEAPKKFMERNMDPLFINNAQVPFAFILLSIVLYMLSILTFLVVQFIDSRLAKEITKPQQPFQIFKIKQFKQRTITRTVQTISNNQQTVSGNAQTTITTIIHNKYVIQLLIILDNINNILHSRIKSTISLCLLDITMTVTLQLLFASQFQYSVIAINQLLALLSVMLIFYQLYQSFTILNIHTNLAENLQFKLKYGCYYEGINIKSQFGFLYNFIGLLRKILYIVFTVYFYSNPLLQTTLCFITCISGVLLIIYQNPFESKRMFVQQLIQNGSVSIIIFCATIFALDDQTRAIEGEVKIAFGWLMIVFILLALFSEILTLIYEIGKSCYSALRKWKDNIQKRDEKKVDSNIKQEQRLQFNPQNGRIHFVLNKK